MRRPAERLRWVRAGIPPPSDTWEPRGADLPSVPQELNLPVVGSQLVGLVPLKALLDAAAFYCDREKLFILEEEHRIRLVGCVRVFLEGGRGGS